MDFTCNFCNKKYATISSLNHHQKSAKFCLELQKKIDNIETKIVPSIYNCEYCEKIFTTKFSLSKHIDICDNRINQDKVNDQIKELKLIEEQYLKEKSELEKQNITLQHELKEKNTLNQELKLKEDQHLKDKSELEKQIITFKYELKEKETQLKEKEHQINSQREDFLERISKLENTIKEKDTILAKNFDKLTTELANRPNIVNNTNNSYTIEFNKLKDDLLPFTDENIRNCIKTINSNTLIYFNDFDVSANFIGNFINSVKTLAFCTDVSRGCLVIKDENGKSSKIMARDFTAKCFDKGKKECIQVLDRAVKFLEQENRNQDIDDIEFSKCLNTLTYIKGHITQGTENNFIRELASNLSKLVPQISKNKSTNTLIEV